MRAPPPFFFLSHNHIFIEFQMSQLARQNWESSSTGVIKQQQGKSRSSLVEGDVQQDRPNSQPCMELFLVSAAYFVLICIINTTADNLGIHLILLKSSIGKPLHTKQVLVLCPNCLLLMLQSNFFWLSRQQRSLQVLPHRHDGVLTILYLLHRSVMSVQWPNCQKFTWDIRLIFYLSHVHVVSSILQKCLNIHDVTLTFEVT